MKNFIYKEKSPTLKAVQTTTNNRFIDWMENKKNREERGIDYHNKAEKKNQEIDIEEKRVSFHTSLIQFREGEWCARLHQRENYQDWKIYRGDEKNCSRDCERVWRIQKYSP